ncbi:MAG: CheY-like chemotaxis protein [Candidatus Latescibacterota bacterium]|jgi:CheY-like chemotaxis protein
MNLTPQNQRILIVDDTIKNLQVLGTILENEGYQINVA